MSTPEGKVKDAIKKYLKGIDGLWLYWPVQMGMGVAGVPDAVGCYRGWFFAIEVKAPGKINDLRPAQELQIGAIRNATGKVFITDDAGYFLTQFCAWTDGIKGRT